jgi:hypothetical protein
MRNGTDNRTVANDTEETKNAEGDLHLIFHRAPVLTFAGNFVQQILN